MSGLLRHSVSAIESQQGTRSMDAGNGSPLKLFVQAKKKINAIFNDVYHYVDESEKYLDEVSRPPGFADVLLVESDTLGIVHKHKAKATGILEVLKRNHMKVVFFGRTSNGKSTVINAMLKKKILPSGIGHTTNCFLQIEGSDQQEPYLITEDAPDDRKNVESVEKLAHALCSEKLCESSLVRVVWPSAQCNLLKDDVILVDSPGIDVSPDLDDWIDKYCLDADVFVLVANAESTLMQAEKNFFHKVSQRLSKPNIFILNNRWDASAQEPEFMEEVKQQHWERNVKFLSNELNVTAKNDAKDRIFFVSSKETLATRLPKGAPGTPLSNLADGFQGRVLEFQDFEKKFEQCISMSAVKTKFEQHTIQGKTISRDLHNIMEKMLETASNCRTQKIKKRQEQADHVDFINTQLELITTDIKQTIQNIMDEVNQQVGTALNEEIRRLPTIVDEYEKSFHSDPIVLDVYKKELHAHVETGIGRNLNARCSTSLESSLQSARQEMTERILALVPEEAKSQVMNLTPRNTFKVSYLINCHNLCQDFQEDIEFRFSYGISAMMQRFLGPKSARIALLGYTEPIPRPLPMTPQSPSNVHRNPTPHEEIMSQLMLNAASLTSRSTMTVIVIGGVIWRAVGWRIIALSGSIYAALYLYERLTYTNRAKERKFKLQYVDYVTQKLKLIVDHTSSNCSHQMQQELASTFASLCYLVDRSKADLQSQLQQLECDIGKLKDAEKQAKAFRNKADFLDHELDTFIKQYLKL